MTIIQALNLYKELKIDANNYRHIYEQLNDTIALGGMNYDGMPHGSNVGSVTEGDSLRLNEAYMKYVEKLNNATTYMLKIEHMIQVVPDCRGRYVLTEKYLKFRAIDDISQDEIIQRCGRQARRYHDDAIEYLMKRYHDEISRKKENL